MKKLLTISIVLLASVALAQDITNHSVPVGGGPGAVGWRSVGPCTTSQVILGAGASADPVCGSATAAIPSNSVTNSMLSNMANGTTKCRVTAGTGAPEDCTGLQAESLLQFQQPGTGGSVRTLDAKIKDSCINAKDYGAVGDDATDNATAFTNAYNAVVARGGGVLCISNGIYRASSFPTVSANNICIIGEGDFSAGTILRHTAASGDFVILTGQHDCLRSLYFWPTQRKTAGYEIKISGSFHGEIEHVRIDYAWSGIFINDSSQTYVGNVQLRNLLGSRGITYGGSTGSFSATVFKLLADNPYPVSSPTAASVKTWAISTAFTAGQIINNNGKIYQCSTSGTSAGAGTGPTGFPSGTSPESAFTGTITDGTAVWKFVSDNNLAWINNDSFAHSLTIMNAALLNGAMGLLMSDSANTGSSFPQFLSVFDLETDHPFSNGVQLDGGNSVLLTNAWIGSTLNGHGLLINTNHKGEVAVGQSRIMGNANNGILIQSGPVNNLIQNSFILNNSAVSSGTFHGINIGNNATHITIKGNRIGPSFAGGNNQGFAVVSGGTSDYLIVTQNDVQGNVTGAISNGASGTHNIIADNAGYNPVGVSSPAPGASPWTYTAGPTPETVYPRASTNVTQVSLGGTNLLAANIAAGIPVTVHLGPNESVVITYTGTLTMPKFVH